MFDLLTPLFATAGALAAAVPFVLHMLRRTPSQKMPFSMVRFLKPSLPRMTRRSTIEHWPLMLLRILALILIGLAFGRPFQRLAVEAAGDQGSASRIAVLLDASASMRREGLREQVIAQLREVTADLRDSDAFSVSVYSQTSRTLISASEWAQTEPGARMALVDQVIESYEPDWLTTHTGAALLNAAEDVTQEVVRGPEIGERRIVLITDFQQGSRLDELQAATWPAGVAVDLRLVRTSEPGNAGVQLQTADQDGQPRVRVVNSADASNTDFALQPFDIHGNPVGRPVKASVAPGQRRSIAIPVSDEQGTAAIAGVELLEDAHPFDNVADLPMVDNPLLKVVHVGTTDSNDASDMKYYLQRAIDGNDNEPFELIDAAQSDGVVLPIGSDVRLVMVTDVVPSGLVTSLRQTLENGGSLLVAVRNLEVLESIAALLPAPLAASEANVGDYAMLGQVDFDSPLFAAFSDARFSDFSSIRFWRHREFQLDPADTTYRAIARFDSGSPAILEHTTPAGGRIILFATGWHPDDSQWALSTRFAPMITSLIRQSYPRSSGQFLFAAGDVIVPEELIGATDWTLQLPDQTSVDAKLLLQQASETDRRAVSDASLKNGSTDRRIPVSYMLAMPGRYTLTGNDEMPGLQLTLLVGVPATETRTDALPLGQLQALGVQAEAADRAREVANGADVQNASQMSSAELESRQKWWRWLLLAGLGCLGLETLIASGIEHRHQLESAA